MEAGEPIAPPAKPNNCSEDCPFCKEPILKGYKTKKGAQKDERQLRTNLRVSTTISSEKGVGKVYPLDGGGDRTIGWQAKEGVFEDFPVKLAAAPHHLIPGKASMAKSRLEDWTVAGECIKEDIGYNIDCAQNGVFLPHLPEIYWTKHRSGTKTPQSKYYGVSWSALSTSTKQSVGFVVMTETWLQMHYTDHDDPYIYIDHEKNYDDECKLQCNHLADLMELKALNAKCCDEADDKLNPPYELVNMINAKSRQIKINITGNPRNWSDFISPLAQDFWNALRTTGTRPSSKFLISKLTD